MSTAAPLRADRTAEDGSPYPDRTRPTFERDVRAMFTHIASRYDWFDHMASLGNDYLWRPRALWDLDRFRSSRPIRRILDVGCGTGDLTRLAAHHYPRSAVVGADFTEAMLRKASHHTGAPRHSKLDYARATALRLPFREETFDLAMSAFVARNIPRLAEAFSEIRRVLAPGGVLLTLEITEPESPVFRSAFHSYFDRVVPWLGAGFKSAGPYRYLPESLKFLPSRPDMMELFRRCGYSRVAARTQSFGIVTTFLAECDGVASEVGQRR